MCLTCIMLAKIMMRKRPQRLLHAACRVQPPWHAAARTLCSLVCLQLSRIKHSCSAGLLGRYSNLELAPGTAVRFVWHERHGLAGLPNDLCPGTPGAPPNFSSPGVVMLHPISHGGCFTTAPLHRGTHNFACPVGSLCSPFTAKLTCHDPVSFVLLPAYPALHVDKMPLQASHYCSKVNF
jgi:hypothetical protein